MDKQTKLNQLCKYAIARVDSRKVLDKNHKKLKGVKLVMRPYVPKLVANINDIIEKGNKYAQDMDLHMEGNTIYDKILTYEDLPVPREVITTPEELKYYKMCYAIIYKSTKFIPRGSVGNMSLCQYRHSGSNISTTVVIESIAILECIVEELFHQIVDIAVANRNVDADSEDARYLADTFRYNEFSKNHRVGMGTFDYACIEHHLTPDMAEDLYRKNIHRKVMGVVVGSPFLDDGYYSLGNVRIKAKLDNGSTLEQYVRRGMFIYGWASRRNKNISQTILDGYKRIFESWTISHKNYIGRECAYKKKSRINELIRFGYLPK